MKADIESSEIEETSDFVARDRNHIYYGWTKLSKADRETFERIRDSYWKDKNFAYIENKTSVTPLKGLDSSSFSHIGNGFAFDKDFAYWYGRVIKSCTSPHPLKVVCESDSIAMDTENVYYESVSLKMLT